MPDLTPVERAGVDALWANPSRAGRSLTHLDTVRVALAAVEPLIRAQVADEIGAEEADAIEWKMDFGVLSAAINDLYAMHAPRQVPTAPEGYVVCDTCDQGPPPARHVRWPCPTVQRLDAACAELVRGAVAREYAKETADG